MPLFRCTGIAFGVTEQFRCVSHSLSLPLSSCLGCIPLLVALPFCVAAKEDGFLAVSVLCGCLLFVSSVFALFVSLLCPSLATMSFAGYFLVRFLLYAFPAFFFLF